jgi:16S rRNA (guanine527-N7)-methyltransferase
MQPILKYFSEFSDKQLQQLEALETLYKDWNNKINVISRKDFDSLYLKHVLHSLSIAAVFDFTAGSTVIDIGTGGGFPGIPLAIYFPEVRFHLVDSIGKKLKVVEAIASTIKLENITVQQIRAEEIKNREFDFAVSRAVASLKDLWKWSAPLLGKNLPAGRPGNKNNFNNGLICLKGGDLSQEIAEAGLHPEQINIHEIFNEEYFLGKYLLYVPLRS